MSLAHALTSGRPENTKKWDQSTNPVLKTKMAEVFPHTQVSKNHKIVGETLSNFTSVVLPGRTAFLLCAVYCEALCAV